MKSEDKIKFEFILLMEGDISEQASLNNLPHAYDPVTKLSRVKVYAPTMPDAIVEGEKLGKVLSFL
jgi:hypothetical protein